MADPSTNSKKNCLETQMLQNNCICQKGFDNFGIHIPCSMQVENHLHDSYYCSKGLNQSDCISSPAAACICKYCPVKTTCDLDKNMKFCLYGKAGGSNG